MAPGEVFAVDGALVKLLPFRAVLQGSIHRLETKLGAIAQ